MEREPSGSTRDHIEFSLANILTRSRFLVASYISLLISRLSYTEDPSAGGVT